MPNLARSPRLALVLALLVLAEWWWRMRLARRGYDLREAAASLAIGLGHVVSAAAAALVLGGVFAAAWRLAPVHWPLHDGRTWALGFVAVELAYYGFHRASHRVRWLWATHAVHHSPTQMTLLSAIRLGWTGLLSLGWAFYLPLVLAGFDPRLVFTLLALNLHYQFFLHTEAIGDLGPLEWILNTPTHHRVHHGCNPEYLDCNYGGVLIVFDRLFGSFRAQRADVPIRYGLAHPLPDRNPFGLVFGEWRRLLLAIRAAHHPRAALTLAIGRP